MDRWTSRLAAGALILGLLSISVSAGVVAIVLGAVALYRLRKSSGSFAGSRMALTGLTLAVLVPLAWTYYESHRSFASRMVCGINLARIGKAMQVYGEAHDGNLPTPANWCDILLNSTETKPAMLQCKSYRQLVKLHKYPLERYLYARWRHAQYLKAGASDYTMNPRAVEKGAAGNPDTVLLFESGPGWNQIGGPEAITAEHHEGDGCNILFLDGSARFVHTQEFTTLRWQP